MGRRKVDPSKRVRAVRACVQCKRSKKRCDASLPCTNCRRRSLSEYCTFEEDEPTRKVRETQAEDRHPGQHRHSRQQHFQQDGQVIRHVDILDPATGGTENDERSADASASTAATPHRTRSRMLSNSRGEKVYIGPSASLSFLQLIRDTVTQSLGNSEFAQYSKRDTMLEAEQHNNSDSISEPDYECHRKQEYVQTFLAATKGLLGFLSQEEASLLVESYATTISPDLTYRHSVACLIVAIGAQCSVKDANSLRDERVAISTAQKASFSGRLEDPNLEMVQSFLLLAFYSLGACKRNAAFMYLGVAARAAFALGLHSNDSDRSVSQIAKRSSRNTWKSLVNLDLIVSSILGRTAATAVSKSIDGDSVESNGYGETTEEEIVHKSYELAVLTDEIVSTLYQSHGASVEAAERFLAYLNQWSESLPSHLRISKTPESSDEQSLARVCGSLHISCHYHFAVMLVSRPFLISHLVNQARNDSFRTDRFANPDTPEATTVAEMAQNCLTAAVFMAQTCSDILEAGFIMANMCILKAWIFAAGLVLGFHMFATEQTDLEVDEAFMGARNVLSKIAARSLQAAHYTDILKHLASAIAKQRRLRRSWRQGREHIAVDKILDLRSSTVPQQPFNPNEVRNVTADLAGLPTEDLTQNMTFDTYQNPGMDLDGAVFGWDSAALQFWDQFPFDGFGLESNDGFVGLNY